MAKSVGKGVREKLRRAHMHRQDFERRVQRFIHSDAYSYSRQDDVEAGKRRWIFHAHKPMPVIRWGALVGECLFNFRSALDHLAYDLSIAYTPRLSARQERKSEFPIFWKRAPRTSELDSKIGAMHPDARQLIETMQPYGRRDRTALKYLDTLHNFDKHRTIHLVTAVSTGVSLFHGDDFMIDRDFEVNFGTLKDGDVLVEADLAKELKEQHDPHFTFGVAFPEPGPGAKAPNIAWTLNWIGQHIEGGVIEPLRPYL